MAIDTNEFKADFAEIVQDIPVTVVHNNTTYTGTCADSTEADALIAGGFEDQSTLEVQLPRYTLVNGAWTAAFVTEPKTGDGVKVVWSAQNTTMTLTVLKVSHSVDQTKLILTLGPPKLA